MLIWLVSILGYWRSSILLMELSPSSRMMRLTTVASTGRRMNRSVNFMCGGSRSSVRFHAVVDFHLHAILQFLLAGGDHHVARLKSLVDGHAAIAYLAGGDEYLADLEHRLAVSVFAVLFYDEYRTAVQGIIHGRIGHGYRRFRVAGVDLHVGKHAGTQQLFGIVDSGLQRDIVGIRVHRRVNGREFAGKNLLWIGIHRHFHALALC